MIYVCIYYLILNSIKHVSHTNSCLNYITVDFYKKPLANCFLANYAKEDDLQNFFFLELFPLHYTVADKQIDKIAHLTLAGV